MGAREHRALYNRRREVQSSGIWDGERVREVGEGTDGIEAEEDGSRANLPL